MQFRQPLIINIFIVLFLITFIFRMFTGNNNFLYEMIYFFSLLLGVIVAIIINFLNLLIDLKKYTLLNDIEKKKYNSLKKMNYFQQLLYYCFYKKNNTNNKMIIDHGFDGIIELNNSLPKWWLFLFYFGIIIGLTYLCLFFFTITFSNPQYELELDTMLANQQQKDYWSKVDQPTIETVQLNRDYVEEGKELFNINCVSCHKEGGKGGIGPNLTDDYWINIEKESLLKNIFYLIWNGSKNNQTMRGFGVGGELNGIQVEKIANYVYYINQIEKDNIENSAAPQGKKVVWQLKD